MNILRRKEKTTTARAGHPLRPPDPDLQNPVFLGSAE